MTGFRFSAAVVTSFLAGVALIAATPHPKEVSQLDWLAIRAEYERHKNAVTASETGGWRATNHARNWSVRFDGRGIEITPRDGAWRWGLQLRSYGYMGAEQPLFSAQPAASANVERFSYQWDSRLREWYVNRQSGLEHGYTLSQPPGNRASGLLILRLNVIGDLTPEVSADGQSVSFAGKGTVLNYDGLKAFDANGKTLKAWFRAESDSLRLELEDRDAVYPLTIDPVVREAYLKPAAVGSTQFGDRFGTSVAASGSTVVVGAPWEGSSTTGVNSSPNEMAPHSGAAYVFARTSAGIWVQEAYLKPSWIGTTQLDDDFGASVSISGDRIVVGAPGEDSSSVGWTQADELAPNAGAAHVFERVPGGAGGIWVPRAYLKPAAVGANQANDRFGGSVSISGDTIIVGAAWEDSCWKKVNGIPDEGCPDSGAAYIFEYKGYWRQAAYLKYKGGRFGFSVAISGDSAVVGAPENGDGMAYIFRRSAGGWGIEAELTPPPYIAYGPGATLGSREFGGSVAISGDVAIVGRKWSVNYPQNPGRAYIFSRNPDEKAWGLEATLEAGQDPQLHDLFGASVAISGNVAVVGNPVVNLQPGSLDGVQIFTRKWMRSRWVWQKDSYIAPQSKAGLFAFSVAVDSGLVIVGHPGESSSTTGINSKPDTNAMSAGAAYAFILTNPVSVTLSSFPGGQAFAVSGMGCQSGTYFTPIVLSWVPGSACTLTFAPSAGGLPFLHWDDSSTNPARTIVAPLVPTRYVAYYVGI